MAVSQEMTVKTDVSRFHIHDELTAPDATAPLIKSIQTAGGTVSKFIGVLAESPAALRGYTRLRTELRQSKLPRATRERISLAVAEWRNDPYTLTQYARTARVAGLGLDELPPHHLVEEAREAGWSDEEILDAVAEMALAEFESLFASVAALPQEGDPAVLREAAA